MLGLELVQLLLPALDLLDLGRRQRLEVLLGLELLLLHGAQLRCELVKHLVQHPENLPGPRAGAGLEDGLRVVGLQKVAPLRALPCRGLRRSRDQVLGEVERQHLRGMLGAGAEEAHQGGALVPALADLHEGRSRPVPLLPARAHELVLQSHVPEKHPNAGEHRRVELQHRGLLGGPRALVLGEHGDGVAEVGHGLHHVCLLAAELRRGLLSEGPGLLEGLLILRDLGLQVVNHRRQLAEAGGALLGLGAELRVPRLGVRDLLRLLLVVAFAPANHLVVHRRLLAPLILELLLHLVQQVDDPLNGAQSCL
mmetsp:Transcript_117872/g.340730  ORF Transcript_117872/g.340730 Transcript_117872/m.340730 type:complete len:310 (+) Transcript_117872:814-1743(+)